MNHPSELFDKYSFIDVFIPMWTKAMKIENTIKGFEKSGVFLWNPQVMKTGKLTPSSIYEKLEPMPEIENSIVEPAERDVPAVESAKPELSTNGDVGIAADKTKKSNGVEMKKFGNEPQ